MNEILNRIHLGVMGNALCHATYGWFCQRVYGPEILRYTVFIVPRFEFALEL